MIAELPTGPRGRLLALGLLFFALAVAYALIAAPLLDLYAEHAASVETRRTLLLKLNQVAAELPLLRAQTRALRAAVDSNKVTLEGATDAIASAALQGRIEELAAAADVTIGSAESLLATTQDSFRRLGLRLTLTGSYDSLVKLFAALETAAPPLVIDNLQIHNVQRRPGVALSTLNASLEVSGFRAAPGGDAAKP